MVSPDDRRYADTHEWHKLEGNYITIGITKFAVDELTDITYVEITKSQQHISAGESLGEIESVKATSDIYSGVDGQVVEVNQEVINDPSIVNRDPYGQGWIVRITADDPSQIESLKTAGDYDQSTR